METWVVLVAATVSLSLGGGYAVPCENDLVAVTPSPPVGPCLSQSIEKAAGTTVPYVADAVEEILAPTKALLPTLLPLAPSSPCAPAELPCANSLPLPTPLSFALPTPPKPANIFSLLSQAQDGDPAAALSNIAKLLANTLPTPQLRAAAAYEPAPTSPCATPAATAPCALPAAPAPCATPVTPLQPISAIQAVTSLPSALNNQIDLATLLKLGVLPPALTTGITSIPIQTNPLINLGAIQPFALQQVVEPVATAAVPLDSAQKVALATLQQQANLGLNNLPAETLAQLTLAASLPAATKPSATTPDAATATNAEVAAAVSPASGPAHDLANFGQISKAWSKLYDPLRRLHRYGLGQSFVHQ